MKQLTGVNTHLMTPFTDSNEIDVHGIFRQIDRVLDAGATSVIVQGKSASTTRTPWKSVGTRRGRWSIT